MMLPGTVANDWPGMLFSDRNPISSGGRLSAISCLQAARGRRGVEFAESATSGPCAVLLTLLLHRSFCGKDL